MKKSGDAESRSWKSPSRDPGFASTRRRRLRKKKEILHNLALESMVEHPRLLVELTKGNEFVPSQIKIIKSIHHLNELVLHRDGLLYLRNDLHFI